MDLYLELCEQHCFVTGSTEAELKKTQEEKDKMMREKDDEINRLQMKIDGMEKDYERIVDVSGCHRPTFKKNKNIYSKPHLKRPLKKRQRQMVA